MRNRKSNPEGISPRDLTYCSHKPECIGTTNPDRSVLITLILWHFQSHPVNVSNLHVKGHMCWKREPFHALLPLLHHVVPLNGGNCRLTIPVVKGRCAREALSHAFNIGVLKYGQSNPITMKHIFTMNLRTLMKVVTLLWTAIIESSINSASDWRGEYGDMRWPSLHTRLLDAGHR